MAGAFPSLLFEISLLEASWQNENGDGLSRERFLEILQKVYLVYLPLNVGENTIRCNIIQCNLSIVLIKLWLYIATKYINTYVPSLLYDFQTFFYISFKWPSNSKLT